MQCSHGLRWNDITFVAPFNAHSFPENSFPCIVLSRENLLIEEVIKLPQYLT